MAKLYWIGGLIALGGLLIFGILQYGVSIGRAKCENAQNQAIQVVNNQITQAHNVIDSADLHAIICGCAKQPVAVVKNGQVIHLRECEIYSECVLDEVSLRQIALNNEILK